MDRPRKVFQPILDNQTYYNLGGLSSADDTIEIDYHQVINLTTNHTYLVIFSANCNKRFIWEIPEKNTLDPLNTKVVFKVMEDSEYTRNSTKIPVGKFKIDSTLLLNYTSLSNWPYDLLLASCRSFVTKFIEVIKTNGTIISYSDDYLHHHSQLTMKDDFKFIPLMFCYAFFVYFVYIIATLVMIPELILIYNGWLDLKKSLIKKVQTLIFGIFNHACLRCIGEEGISKKVDQGSSLLIFLIVPFMMAFLFVFLSTIFYIAKFVQ